MAKNSVLRYT